MAGAASSSLPISPPQVYSGNPAFKRKDVGSQSPTASTNHLDGINSSQFKDTPEPRASKTDAKDMKKDTGKIGFMQIAKEMKNIAVAGFKQGLEDHGGKRGLTKHYLKSHGTALALGAAIGFFVGLPGGPAGAIGASIGFALLLAVAQDAPKLGKAYHQAKNNLQDQNVIKHDQGNTDTQLGSKSKTISFNNYGNKFRPEEVAINLPYQLLAGNNPKLKTLDFSRNFQVSDSFVADLIKNGDNSEAGGRHALNGLTVKLQETPVKNLDSIIRELNLGLPHHDISVVRDDKYKTESSNKTSEQFTFTLTPKRGGETSSFNLQLPSIESQKPIFTPFLAQPFER